MENILKRPVNTIASEATERQTLKRHRIAISTFFFLQGLCFASWASRIPEIQSKLQLTEAALGMVLLSIPVGLLLSLPFSGWLVAKIGSRKVLAIGLSAYALVLVAVGYAETRPELILYLFLFGFSGNMSNVAVNTQAVAVEGLYKRPIMASFHGVWSVAGFTAAFIGTFMIGRGIIPFYHFIAITLLIVSLVIFFYQDTVKAEDKKTPGKVFVFPDKTLIRLGIIAFCTMICEGTMFDWSGVYFHKVIKAEGAWATAGYMAFMSTMAIGRFISDAFTYRFGSIRTLQLSGGLICTGLFIAVCFPNLPTGIVGFLLVGFGVSSVVPLVYSAAGNSTSMEVGMAITAVSTIGFFGFLIGPPLIGLVAGLSNLRISFSVIALMGLVIIKLSKAGKLKT